MHCHFDYWIQQISSQVETECVCERSAFFFVVTILFFFDWILRLFVMTQKPDVVKVAASSFLSNAAFHSEPHYP